jgi:short-subunit dehydrogenase
MKNLNAALVTGSGRSIGKQLAILLIKKGMNLILCSRTTREIDLTAGLIETMSNSQVVSRVWNVSVPL